MEEEMNIVAEVRNYRELKAVFLACSEKQHVTRLAADAGAGLSPGYSAKLLCAPGAKNSRNFGMTSLGAMLSLLGLKILVVEDQPEQLKRPLDAPPVGAVGK
jgi:uncharacterized metal-binding protein